MANATPAKATADIPEILDGRDRAKKAVDPKDIPKGVKVPDGYEVAEIRPNGAVFVRGVAPKGRG